MDRFRSNEAPIVVSTDAQLARLKLTGLEKGLGKKDIAFCSHCEQKGHFEMACKEKGKSLKGGTNQSSASLCAKSCNFEVNRSNFVIDLGNTLLSRKSIFW